MEQTSSASPSVLCASVPRTGRISCSTTGTPAARSARPPRNRRGRRRSHGWLASALATWTIPRRMDAARQWPRARTKGKIGREPSDFLAGVLLLSLMLGTGPAAAIKLLPAVEQLYSSVEMEPPSATHMTVCYGFVCRLRLTLVFTAAERTSITNMMNKGRASPRRSERPSSRCSSGSTIGSPATRHQQAHRQCGRAFVRRQSQLRLLGHARGTRQACCWCCRNGA